MQILVTGGAGFIGSHTCVALIEQGYEIVIYDNLSNSDISSVRAIEQITGKNVPFYQGDVLDAEALGKVFQEHDIGAVIHFAGLKAVGESTQKPLLYYHNNVGGTISLCRVMQQYQCRRIVFSSSATVYGIRNPIPYTEDMPLSAESPYGWTKLMIEHILDDISAADPSWSVVNLRYFNPIGAHESGLLGENPRGIPNNLFPYISRVAVRQLPYLQVFGGDYETPDGTGVRDYIHVCDLAEGHVAALDYAKAHTGTIAVNLGTGRGTSVLELTSAFEKASKKEIPYRIVDRRPGDIAMFYADTAKAKEVLHWQAKRDIEKMCEDGWRYIERMARTE